ncbi:hypothetical protein VMCG_05751 [Cytospora schulzeri]|uniref:Alpha/beta hydrolase fold-3 domain-containing protein n=1 Tax=Cytospora schulzeri TaxID=448051 RepID=A0A423WHY1_9PEZI|nr:hypothetical protein VMCG_05751 [Valsa malicola]
MAPPKQSRHPVVSYQPIRTIYRLIKLTTALAKAPFWIIRALIPALRQHPKWTYKQSLTVSIARAMISVRSTIAITETQSLEPKTQGDRWARLQPFDDELYVGPLLSEKVRPGEAGGTWYPALPADPKSLKKVIMHIHGGAFVEYTGRDDDSGYLCNRLLSAGGFDAVFAPQYRLAGHAGRDPFPAALQDVLTCYLYLVRTLGVSPGNLTVSGDSAGGNLAAALLRYLERFGEGLGVPLPGRVVLVSPWVQPAEAVGVDYTRWREHGTDFLPVGFLTWGLEAYGLQSDRYGDCGEYVNSLGHPFRTSVPVLVTVGSVEILCPQDVRWVDEMRGVEGNRIELDFQEAAPHDVLFVGDKMGWDETVVDVMGKIGKFVDGQ